MSKRTKVQLTKDELYARGDTMGPSDDENEMDTPQMASKEIMAARPIANFGKRFMNRKKQQLPILSNNTNTNNNTTATTAPNDSTTVPQMKSLNANFLKSINEGINKNPIADLSSICTKYLEYVSKVQDKKIEVRTLNVPKVEVKPESIKTDKPNPFAMFASTAKIEKEVPKVETKTELKFENIKPTVSENIKKEVDQDEDEDEDEDENEDEEDDKEKEIKIQGPSFTLSSLPKSKDYGFKFGYAPPKDEDDSDDEIVIKGPTFTSNLSVSDSVFKLPSTKPAEKKEEKKENQKPSIGFSFGTTTTESKPFLPSITSTKPQSTFTLPENKNEPTFEIKKDVTSAFQPTAAVSTTPSSTKPSFLFGNPVTSTSGFSFGAPSSTTDKVPSTPAFNFGQNASSSAFSFGKSNSASSDKNTNSLFSIGSKTESSNPFNIGKPSSFTNPSSGSMFNFNAPTMTTPNAIAPATTTATNTDTSLNGNIENDEETKEAERDSVKGNFAVVHLTEKVDVKTGEEEEEALCSKRSKISKYNAESNGYDQVGLGEFKVLKNKSTNKSRILVRSEGSSNILLNVSILSQMKYSLMGDKQNILRIPSVNANGDLETFIARVKTQADAEELLKSINNCQ